MTKNKPFSKPLRVSGFVGETGREHVVPARGGNQDIFKSHQQKEPKETNEIYVYGLHPVSALMRKMSHRICELFVQEGRSDAVLQEILCLATKLNVPVRQQSRVALDGRSQNAVHQGVVARIAKIQTYTESDLDTILSNIEGPPFLLILDSVQDPHNLGACLRSANAAGVHAVIAPKDKSVSLTAVAYKVASGAAEITPFIQVTNLVRTLEKLKKLGIWVYGACSETDKLLYTADLKRPIAWVLGAEGTGLRRLTRESCDELLSIPMQGVVSSLNVSVAAGICLFETVRQWNL